MILKNYVYQWKWRHKTNANKSREKNKYSHMVDRKQMILFILQSLSFLIHRRMRETMDNKSRHDDNTYSHI